MKNSKTKESTQRQPQPKNFTLTEEKVVDRIESNRNRYVDELDPESTSTNLDSLGSDFSKLLTESREFSKNLSHADLNDSKQLNNLKNDLFKLDANKLKDALECSPFYLQLFTIDSPQIAFYMNKPILDVLNEGVSKHIDKFKSRYEKVESLAKKDISDDLPTTTTGMMEKTSDISIESGLNLKLNEPKDENIDDWLNDLIN